MSTIEAIQKENAELRRIVGNHAAEIERVRLVVYQLVGGLYNQKTQRSIQKLYLGDLYGIEHEEDEEEDENENENEDDEDDEDEDEDDEAEYLSNCPTTRQGDKHEERIRKMEEIMKNIEERVLSVENKLM